MPFMLFEVFGGDLVDGFDGAQGFEGFVDGADDTQHLQVAVTGLTVMEYITKTRILLAKQRIEQGERNMARIGEECGFACQSHFSKAFKVETGRSPLQYRKEIFHDTDHTRVALPQVGAGI